MHDDEIARAEAEEARALDAYNKAVDAMLEGARVVLRKRLQYVNARVWKESLTTTKGPGPREEG